MKLVKRLAQALALMIALQAARELLEWPLRSLAAGDFFWERMATAAAMLLLSAVVVGYARLRKTRLSVFPKRFAKGYIIATCVAAALLIATPANFTGGYRAILLLVYGSVITPVYEELLFRGYLWNRLNEVTQKESHTCLWTITLFTVWHLGYMIPQLAAGNWSAVWWKLAAGLGYGAVLGFVRLKTGSCYAAMLAHGVLNNFMI